MDLQSKILNILFKNGVKEGTAHQITKQIMKSPELNTLINQNTNKTECMYCGHANCDCDMHG